MKHSQGQYAAVQSICNLYSIELDEYQIKEITEHTSCVLEETQKTNLTAIASFEDALHIHIEDSLSPLPYLKDLTFSKYADIGTGAGYPGIPLGIALNVPTFLFEATAKKTSFLEHFLSENVLESRIHVVNSRIEKAEEYFGQFDLVSARALSSAATVVELATPLLTTGGVLLLYKARIDNAELESGIRAAELCGLELTNQHTLTINNNTLERTILLFKKAGEAQVKLPRRDGMAQKRPLA